MRTTCLSLLIGLRLLCLAAQAEQPTAAAISAYSTECKRTGRAMDLITRFGRDYSGLDLSGVDFRGAHTVDLETNLQGADFSGANLQGAEFGAAQLDGVDFTGANLSKAQFVTASLRQAVFRKSNLTGAHFQECDLAGAQLQGVKLSDATWAGYLFQGADLTGADLSGMSLPRANFKNATFHSADLSGCHLEAADFQGADLISANLSRADIRHANFDNVRGLPPEELSRLVARTGRWQMQMNRAITKFMDSPGFTLCLLVVVPLLAVGWHYLNYRPTPSAASASKSKFRFSIARLFTLVLAVAVVLGIARWTSTGVYSLMMVSALTMMGAEICYAKRGRIWPVTMLVVALGYAMLNLCLYLIIFNSDLDVPILSPGFMGTVILLGPMLTISVAVFSVLVRPAARNKLPWVGLTGLTLWMFGIGTANLFVIARAVEGL